MNDNIANRIQCPFYVAHNSGTGNNITITCEMIKTNMGFNVKNKLFFANQKRKGTLGTESEGSRTFTEYLETGIRKRKGQRRPSGDRAGRFSDQKWRCPGTDHGGYR